MNNEFRLLAECGGIAHSSTLTGKGAKTANLQRLAADGLLLRPRRGWYSLPGADALAVRAVSLGGLVTCVSALHKAGVWCVTDSRLHLAVGAHTGHPPPRSAGIVTHYSLPATRLVGYPLVPVVDALIDQFGCQTRENSIVVLDSALNRGLISRSDLGDIRSRIPRKYRPALDCADGRCESGLETKVRLRLKHRRLRHQTQVQIRGVGRVDILIGDRLVIETDGLEFHTGEAATRDRERDLALHRLGYIVMRLTYAMVMFRWDEVQAVIDGYVSRREHLWTALHVRAGLAR
ncbi:DUF559 domain-containing protein [Mycetocola manganoxydans]|uniref:DUF559 domain-containing protein n=1 Tax=Mycetocola manganoxydans TaxID=699879 RepID=A0A3L7A0H9_9MICO|nr:DUF559 domain-containing protein [Mycetocola manganoxydans]RLP73465.1 DUF559 domain-containing protein [Mycetocola manganoxydans]GHD41596.1 hypothetical protein GCM10008097_06480 [Mycetocola manganoxydans]